ncbi:MAG: hypothetical protein HY644_08040 [Acidobacteria bacterium]|nr:hypothetical protein [Acidobacteriota bacterium]
MSSGPSSLDRMIKQDIFCLDPVSEMEMWIACLNGYFRYHVLPTKGHIVDLGRNFYEELRAADWILGRIQELAAELISNDQAEVKEVACDVAGSPPQSTHVLSPFREQMAIGARLILVIEAVNDIRIIVREKLHTGIISFPFFKSVGRILNRELSTFRKSWIFSDLLWRRVSRSRQQAACHGFLLSVGSAEMRLETTALFARICRILMTARYVTEGLRIDFNYKAFLALFLHLRTQGNILIRRLQQWLARWELLAPGGSEAIAPLMFALKLEMRRVFQQELLEIEKEGRIEVAYARLEDAAGVLWNCYQNVFISLARAFNPGFDEYQIFSNLASRETESVCVYNDLCTIREMVALALESRPEADELLRSLGVFRETSMRYLMFKDWGLLESFIDRLRVSSGDESMSLLGRFLVFLDTLILSVEKRAALRVLDTRGEREAAGN